MIWLPPRSIGERAFATEASLLALVHGPEGAKYTRLSLDALPQLRTVRLIFDARDVTLLRVALPPLSGAKLRLALPNAVEDQLLQDAASCAFGLGPTLEDGRRVVTVIDRSWMEFVIGAFERRGLRVAAAMPAQLAVPFRADRLSLACLHDGLAARTGPFGGIGWSAAREPAQRTEAISSLLATVLAPPDLAEVGAQSAQLDQRALEDELVQEVAVEAEPAVATADGPAAMTMSRRRARAPAPAPAAPQGPSTADMAGTLKARLVVAHCGDDHWAQSLNEAAARLRLPVRMTGLPIPDDWPMDMLASRGGSTMSRRVADIDWRAWRWPIGLLAASLAVFLIGLNLHWGKLASEKADLRAQLELRFRQSFPETRTIVDPVLQMEREVARLRASAGQSGPEDFVPLVSRFAQALGPQATDALTNLEYRDGRLRVMFTPALVEARSVRDNLGEACKRLGLSLQFDSGRPGSATVSLL
ncbi:MAG: type II secretion system protein GspL [Burkholderiaceae bacterium]